MMMINMMMIYSSLDIVTYLHNNTSFFASACITRTARVTCAVSAYRRACYYALAVIFCQRIQFKLCSLVNKCQRRTAPSYLADMCIPVSATSGRTHLRSAVHCDLVVPRTRLARYGPRGFAVSGPLTWNSLPTDLRDTSVCCEFLKPTQD